MVNYDENSKRRYYHREGEGWTKENSVHLKKEIQITGIETIIKNTRERNCVELESTNQKEISIYYIWGIVTDSLLTVMCHTGKVPVMTDLLFSWR